MVKCPPELTARKENQKCADCQALNPDWASVKLGIFICFPCAGIHRKLGTHISFVRSVKLDEWKQDQIDVVSAIGNAKANAYYEHNVPPGKRYSGNVDLRGPDTIDPVEGKKLEVWIRDKYEHKLYAPPGIDDPYVRVKRGEKIDEPGGSHSGGHGHRGGEEPKHRKHKKEKKHSEPQSQQNHGHSGHHQADGHAGHWAQPGAYASAPSAYAAPNAAPYAGAPQPMYPDAGYGQQGCAAGTPAYVDPAAANAQYGGAAVNASVGVAPYGGAQGSPGGGSYGNASYGGSSASSAASERRAALVSISRVLGSPASFGIDQQLLLPHGFNLQSAEFDPGALKRPNPKVASMRNLHALGNRQHSSASPSPGAFKTAPAAWHGGGTPSNPVLANNNRFF